MPKPTNRRRKRGAADEEDAGEGGGTNKRSATTSVLTSLDVNDAPRLELPLFQLNGREEEEEVTGGGGSSSAAAAASGQSPHQQRRLWVKDRSRAWWEQCSSADYPEADFRAAFRMGRATFAMLCDALGAAVAKEDTALRAAIPVRQRVAVCVWRLATGEPLRLVSKRFGLGISTCHKLVLEVCAAIRNLLMPRFLRWPDAAAADAFKARFQADSGIPGVVGASFPLTDWVLAPYAQPNLTWAQHAFNEKVAELRRVAVDAFARLKGRWACLQKRTEVKLQDLPVVLGACCVLHNICESRGEEMDPGLRCELADDETAPEKPVRSDSASKARDDIAHNLLHSGLAGTKFF